MDDNRDCRHHRESRDGADTESLPPQINLLVSKRKSEEALKVAIFPHLAKNAITRLRDIT